jgi:2-polyprenyl-3-methyl-5-hydroxy-6-metoxy-1,4-benzoquinol methylase
MQDSSDETNSRSILSRIKAAVPLRMKATLKGNNGLKPTDAAVWDREFGAGHWDFLSSRNEMPRYAVITGYHLGLAPNATILDMGCGAGILQPWLEQAGYKQYTGVDLSAAAIEQAQARVNHTTRFITANAETYAPTETFDLVIFNEMLYYMTDPVRVLRRYSQYLTPKGTYIISLWQCRESWRVWQKCKTSLTLLDETRVDRNGASWLIRLCKPAASP